MISDFYFFDQFSRASHIGGVYRSKRDLKDLDQALYHVKLASSVDNHDQIQTITNNDHLQTNQRKLKTPIIPEFLTKDLDNILQNVDEKQRSRRSSQQDGNQISNQPKISLPSLLILQLHSSWSDLVQNTQYNYKVWHTKAGEEGWRQYVQRKRSEQVNLNHNPTIHRRSSSRVSLTSASSLSHRQSLITNSKIHLNRSPSRASLLSTSNTTQDNLRLLKAMHQTNSEETTIKNGIHVEFKLSTQIDQTNQKIVLFDVPKSEENLDEDMTINLIQNKCKRLLTETKQKIFATNNNQQKISQIWFYGDNQYRRNKHYLSTLNEINRQQKSKFILSILRHEIPEKFNIDIDIPQIKQKCYVELTDGTSQIYYPSGRLAVLRLRSPYSTTLFFDDTNSTENQFLGLVTSTGNVLLMQPTFHARFITNNRHEYAYLCHGKTGFIEKQIQFNLNNNSQRNSISSNDDDEKNPNSIFSQNTIQFQINSCMQLEYHNTSNIQFAFTCQNEEFQFQLGVHLPTQTSTSKDLTTTILATKKISREKYFPSAKGSNSNDISEVLEKQQILSDEQIHSHHLPMMQELNILRKRIQHICQNWLKECRTTLGIMNIDDYFLSDLSIQEKEKINRKTLKQVKLLTKRASINQEFINSTDKQQMLTIVKPELNVITNVIEQFIPHSDAGRAIKQRISAKKKILPTTLPVI